MAKARDNDLPQHDINQGHFGEIDLAFLPDGVSVGDAIRWNGTTWVVEAMSDSGKVLVSATDDTDGYLFESLEAGTGITLEIVNPGADEKVRISASGGGGAGEVLMVDGITSPPEPLTTEDGTDWLYEG